MNKNILDIKDKKFNNLTAIKRLENNKRGDAMWLFKCDCGKEFIATATGVKNGHTKNCGCKEFSLLGRHLVSHGLSKTRFYIIWQNMRARCLNPNNKDFDNYGGRGIKICFKWLKFENFKEDMYESYLKHVEQFGEKETTIDRVEVNGSYELDNCKWATRVEQRKNQRKK